MNFFLKIFQLISLLNFLWDSLYNNLFIFDALVIAWWRFVAWWPEEMWMGYQEPIIKVVQSSGNGVDVSKIVRIFVLFDPLVGHRHNKTAKYCEKCANNAHKNENVTWYDLAI